MNDLTDSILEIEDVMEYLHLGKNKVYELLRSGQLSYIRCGRKYLIPANALREFVTQRTTSMSIPTKNNARR